jgi:hypothetical protein
VLIFFAPKNASRLCSLSAGRTRYAPNSSLKGIILPGRRDFTVQYQFSCTRHPLNFVLHTNYHWWDPCVILIHLFTPIGALLPSPISLSRLPYLPPRLLFFQQHHAAELGGVAGRDSSGGPRMHRARDQGVSAAAAAELQRLGVDAARWTWSGDGGRRRGGGGAGALRQ